MIADSDFIKFVCIFLLVYFAKKYQPMERFLRYTFINITEL